LIDQAYHIESYRRQVYAFFHNKKVTIIDLLSVTNVNHCLQALGAPFAAVTFNSYSITSEMFCTFVSGELCLRKCSGTIETWTPVSHNISVSLHLRWQLTMHQFPSKSYACIGVVVNVNVVAKAIFSCIQL